MAKDCRLDAWVGILYFQLLPLKQTINSVKCPPWLCQLKTASHESGLEFVSRTGGSFHQDNAKPLTEGL